MTQISNQPTIKDFLLARMAEDEAWAREEDDDYADTALLPTYDSKHQANWNTERVLAECAAKRAIAEVHESYFAKQQTCSTCRDLFDDDAEDYPCMTIRALAAVYSDHPDYRQEWAL